MKTGRFSRPGSPVFQAGVVAALIGFGLYFDHQAAFAPPARTLTTLRAELAREQAAPDVQQVAAWAVDSLDHAGLPFIVIDKARARLFAFDPQGHLHGSAPVLLAASHDDGPPRPATPAGRFVADPGLSARSGGIVWVHADATLSLHRIGCSAAAGPRLQRLASGNAQDERISDGSLQVAADFYRDYLSPLRWQESIAYVLPEALPWQQVFGLQPLPSAAPLTFAQRARRNPL